VSEQEQNDGLYPTVFGEYQIRRVWQDERWFYAIIDIVGALTDSAQPRVYWSQLKGRLKAEGLDIETFPNWKQLKLPAADGKMRTTDCGDQEAVLRVIQSIPSPQAEPFKRWLAGVGNDRLEELGDPELGYQEWRRRAINSYMAQGYTREWAEVRVDTITTRNDLTEEWSVRGIDEKEFAILTDRLHMGIFGLSVQQHMGLKDYPVTRKGRRVVYTGDLRAGMTASELVLTQIGQMLARAQHIDNDSHGLAQITRDIDVAGKAAQAARAALIAQTGQPIPSPVNAIPGSDGGLWGQLPPEDRGGIEGGKKA
jgi:DNA-damage-inducible protein D